MNSATKHQCALIVFCVGSIVAIFFLVSSISGLSPIDDHQLIRTLLKGKSFGAPYVIPELGRFIPLTAQEYALAARIFEPSPYLFHVIGGIKVLICGALLLYCLMLTGAGNWVIAMLWGSLIFSIGFANAAFRLQIGELNALCLVLIFVWSTLVADQATQHLSTKQKLFSVGGLVAIALAMLYKEPIFVFALAFSVAELLRSRRKTPARTSRYLWGLLIVGILYIVFYGIWRAIHAHDFSYLSFHSITVWEIICLYAINDPIIVFIVLPMTCFRVFRIVQDSNQHTIFDSFLVAASAYVGVFLALRIYNSYYLLPAYGFALCGIAGIMATQGMTKFFALALVMVGLLGTNNLPVAVSDMQALRLIANNHYDFVQYISEWIWENSSSNGERRNLVLEGVTAGNGVEIILSLKTFLESMGVSDSTFEITTSEPSDNKTISSFHGFMDESRRTSKLGDLLIFNPYQQSDPRPPLLSPSYREVYRSNSELALPRWTAWRWAKSCVISWQDCSVDVSGSARYTGYAAMLVTRLSMCAPPAKFAQLKFPSYQVGPLLLSSRMRAGTTRQINVLIENTGNEIWPANGVSEPGAFVHLAYVWIDADGHVALEGDRAALPECMQPNDQAKISLLLKTPTRPGKYKLILSPVQEGVRWFYLNNATNSANVIDIF